MEERGYLLLRTWSVPHLSHIPAACGITKRSANAAKRLFVRPLLPSRPRVSLSRSHTLPLAYLCLALAPLRLLRPDHPSCPPAQRSHGQSPSRTCTVWRSPPACVTRLRAGKYSTWVPGWHYRCSPPPRNWIGRSIRPQMTLSESWRRSTARITTLS